MRDRMLERDGTIFMQSSWQKIRWHSFWWYSIENLIFKNDVYECKHVLRNLQMIALNTSILNLSAQITTFLLTVKLLQCNNTIRFSLFEEMKHFELKCRKKIKAIASQCLVKKRSNRVVGRRLTCELLLKEDWIKKSKDVTRDTPYLIQEKQTFFLHISVTVQSFHSKLENQNKRFN